MPKKGYKQIEEHKRKTRLVLLGNKSKSGQTSSEKTRNKMRLAHLGKHNLEKNQNWKGGVSIGENHKKYIKIKANEYNKRNRRSVIDLLGGKCVRCSFNDWRALQIDHINGKGHEERKVRDFKGQFHNHVKKSFLNNENKYQLLCANCNWIKRYENKEVRNRLVI